MRDLTPQELAEIRCRLDIAEEYLQEVCALKYLLTMRTLECSTPADHFKKMCVSVFLSFDGDLEDLISHLINKEQIFVQYVNTLANRYNLSLADIDELFNKKG